jgi:hypothetical protein
MTRITPSPSFSSSQPKFGKIEHNDFALLKKIMLRKGNTETFQVTTDIPFCTASDIGENKNVFRTGQTLTIQSMSQYPGKRDLFSTENPFIHPENLTLRGLSFYTTYDFEFFQLTGHKQSAWTNAFGFSQAVTLTPESLEKLNRLDTKG